MSAAPDDFLAIDPENLDLACMGQPKLMRYWCRQLAVARKKTADAKKELKLAMAEVRSEVRSDPEKFGVIKVNEDSVADAMALDARWQQAQTVLNQAEYDEGVIEANVKALQSRDYQ